jgi:hypothetical protein
MRHDESCERDDVVPSIYGLGCQCGSRAYERDPLPNDWTPIWAKAKTPYGVITNQEGG